MKVENINVYIEANMTLASYSRNHLLSPLSALTVLSLILLILVPQPMVCTPTFSTCSQISAFSITYTNQISAGVPLIQSSQVVTTVSYPATVTFTAPPKFTLGMTRYQSYTNLMDVFFTFFCDGTAGTTSFNLKHNLKTGVWALSYRVLVVDSAFPDHLNLFSNVNIFGSSTISASITLTATQNYTSMANGAGYLFNVFTPVNITDYSYNKIIPFLSCFGFKAHASTTPSISLSYSILDFQNILFTLNIGTVIDVDRLHWSMVVIDMAQLQNSGLYIAHFGSITWSSTTGGQAVILQPYQGQTIMGWTDFAALSQTRYLTFQLTFAPFTGYVNGISNDYGIQMLPPVPQGSPVNLPVQNIGLSYFYLECCVNGSCQTNSNNNNNNNNPNSNNNSNGQVIVTPNSQQILSIQRQGCNGFTIKLNYTSAATLADTRNMIFVNAGITVTNAQINSDNVYVVHAQYTQDIAGNVIEFTINGRQFYYNYAPSLPALYYNQNQCNVQENTYKLLMTYTVLSYVILFISLFSGKIVGLELFGVLQFAYFSISQHSFLSLYLSQLVNFKLFNGLNLPLISQFSYKIPNMLTQMKFGSNFINNCNIMLFIFLLFFIASAACCIILSYSKKITLQKRASTAYNIFKQGMITLILFNLFNFSFSAGVHMKYAQQSSPLFGFSTFLIFITFAIVLCFAASLITTNMHTFGEFRMKFKPSCQNQFYVLFQIVFRIALGIQCARNNQNLYSTLFILGFAIVFFLYVVINLPFRDVYQNYRAALIHGTTLYIVFIADYYRTMKSNTSLAIKGRIYGPSILLLILLAVCIVVSGLVLGREIYQFVKKYRENKNNQVIPKREINAMDKSDGQIFVTQQSIVH